MSEESKVAPETSVNVDEDRTINVRLSNPLTVTPSETEEEDRTVNIRVEKLLNDPRMQAMQAQAAQANTRPVQSVAASSSISNTPEEVSASGPGKAVILVPALLIGGGLLGWIADKALGNAGVPWGLIIGLVLACIGSAVIVLRKSA